MAQGIGVVLGDAVAALLADPVVTAGLPGLLGEVLPRFLSNPVVSAGLASVAGELVAAIAGGADPAVALGTVLPRLLADPQFGTALASVVTEVVGGTLADGELLGLVGSTLAQSVSGLLAVDGVPAWAGGQVSGAVAGREPRAVAGVVAKDVGARSLFCQSCRSTSAAKSS